MTRARGWMAATKETSDDGWDWADTLRHISNSPYAVVDRSQRSRFRYVRRPWQHITISPPMLIVDEKAQPMRGVPPSYSYQHLQPPPFAVSPRLPPALDTPSPHLLLQIIYRLFPQTPDVDRGKAKRQRMTLHYLSTSLRLVNRVFYIGEQLFSLPHAPNRGS